MYYLQSRYFNPRTARFLNADDTNLIGLLSQQSIIGANLFSYCENDSIMNTDPSGYIKISLSRKWSIAIGIIGILVKIKSIGKDIKKMYNLTKSKLSTALLAIHYLGAYSASEIIGYLVKAAFIATMVSTVISFVTSCLTGGIANIIVWAVKQVISYFTPSLINCVLMVYYGFKYNKGSILNIGWFGTSVSFKK